jgi:hypothetical protein
MQLEIVQAVDGVVDQLAALEGACRAQADDGDVTGLDEVLGCVRRPPGPCSKTECPWEGRRDLPTGDVDRGTCRPGVHLLTGRLGKGQEFDWVVSNRWPLSVVGSEAPHCMLGETSLEVRNVLRGCYGLCSRLPLLRSTRNSTRE